MLETIKAKLRGRSQPTVLYECRHCGTNLDADIEACPSCGADEIARFVF